MRCPRCRVALVSGNRRGKSTGGYGEKFMKCPKCGYMQPVSRVTNRTWGKFKRQKEVRA